MEKGGKGEEQEREPFKSIKVKESTREGLRELAKDMGVGIGKAVDILVETRQTAITKKIEDISEISDEIAEILLSSGLLDIKFEGAGVETVNLEGDSILVHGFIRVGIADDDARQEIYEVLKGGLEGHTS